MFYGVSPRQETGREYELEACSRLSRGRAVAGGPGLEQKRRAGLLLWVAPAGSPDNSKDGSSSPNCHKMAVSRSYLGTDRTGTIDQTRQSCLGVLIVCFSLQMNAGCYDLVSVLGASLL